MLQTFPIPETDWRHLNAQAPFGIPSFERPLVTSIAEGFSLGSSTPTFTRATTAYQTDFEGKLNLALSGESRFEGSRREANIVATKSEDWTNAAWTKTIGTVTATTLTSTGANQTVLQTYTHASSNWVMRVRMSRITGTGNIDLTLDGGTGWTTVTLTGSNQVFSIAQTGVTNPQFGIRIVTSGDAINASQIAVYKTEGVTNTNPPEYVSVGVESAPFHGANVDGVKYFSTLNGNTVAANVVTEATGAHIDSSQAAAAGGVTAGVVDASGPLGYLGESAATNEILQSQNFGTTWAPVGATVSLNTTVSPDGTTTADSFIPNNGSQPSYIRQLLTTSANAYTYSIYLKNGALGTNWVQLIYDGTNVYRAWFNLATGAKGSSFGSPTSYNIVALPNSWYRVDVTKTLLAEAAFFYIKAEAADNVNGDVTGDGVKAAFIMWEANIVAASFPSSPVTTTTVAVTRNASVDQYVSADNVPTNDFIIYGETAFNPVPAAASYYLWSSYVDANNSTSVLWDGINLIARKRISGTSHDATIALSPTAGTVFKWAARFTSTIGTDIFLNGTKGTNDATNTACQIGTNFQVGADGNGAGQPNATGRNERIWPRALSNAHLTSLTS